MLIVLIVWHVGGLLFPVPILNIQWCWILLRLIKIDVLILKLSVQEEGTWAEVQADGVAWLWAFQHLKSRLYVEHTEHLPCRGTEVRTSAGCLGKIISSLMLRAGVNPGLLRLSLRSHFWMLVISRAQLLLSLFLGCIQHIYIEDFIWDRSKSMILLHFAPS